MGYQSIHSGRGYSGIHSVSHLNMSRNTRVWGTGSPTFLIEIKCHTVLECLKITIGAVKSLELIPKEARVGLTFS
jgi:hypothetical protein